MVFRKTPDKKEFSGLPYRVIATSLSETKFQIYQKIQPSEN